MMGLAIALIAGLSSVEPVTGLSALQRIDSDGTPNRLIAVSVSSVNDGFHQVIKHPAESTYRGQRRIDGHGFGRRRANNLADQLMVFPKVELLAAWRPISFVGDVTPVLINCVGAQIGASIGPKSRKKPIEICPTSLPPKSFGMSFALMAHSRAAS